MRTTLLKAVLTVGLLGVVQAAEAQQQNQRQGGTRLTGAATQAFEFTDNSNLSGGGSQFKSLTGLNFSLSSETALSKVSASTGASMQLTNGGFSLTRPKLQIGLATKTKRVDYTANLSFARAPTSVDEVLTDLSVLRIDTDRTIISGRFGLSTALDQTTKLSLGVNATSIGFDTASTALVPSTDLGVNGGLTYQLNRRTSYGVNGALGYFTSDTATNTESLSASLDGQLKHELNSRSTFNGNLGLAFIDTVDTVGTATTSAFSVSLLFGAGLTQALPDGSMGISINQEINPSSSGSLALGTRLNGSLTKNIRQGESYTIDASLGRQEDVGGGAVTTFINVSPSYSRQVTRDVSATARYFFQRDDGGSTAQGVTLSFSRPFDFPL